MTADLGAGLRHFRVLARIVARDPVAVAVLVFAGIVAVPSWTFGPVAIDLLRVAAVPSRPGPSVRVLAEISAAMMLVQFLWALLVVAAVMRALAPPSTRPSLGLVMPALPIGRRTRAVAEALLATAFVAIMRVAVLAALGEHLGRHFALLGAVFSSRDLSYPAALALGTIVGALFVFPILLAWTTVARFDARGLVKPMAVAVVLFAAASVGATLRPSSAVLVCIAVSALVLVRLDDGGRPEPRPGRQPAVRYRHSPGPLVQFRRDAWLGPLRTLWPLLVVAVPLPLAVLGRLPRDGSPLLLLLVQLLVLTVLPFFPLGLRLMPSVSGGGLFSGYFLRAWAPLPVPRERVARAAYLHAVASAGSVWLVLLLQLSIHRGGPLWPLFELPAVLLAGALVLCEAVGDRRRGLLALGCLVGFQMVLPVAFVFAGTLLGAPQRFALDGTPLTAAAFALGLLGGLPPLVHLRRRAAPGSAASAV